MSFFALPESLHVGHDVALRAELFAESAPAHLVEAYVVALVDQGDREVG